MCPKINNLCFRLLIKSNCISRKSRIHMYRFMILPLTFLRVRHEKKDMRSSGTSEDTGLTLTLFA